MQSCVIFTVKGLFHSCRYITKKSVFPKDILLYNFCNSWSYQSNELYIVKLSYIKIYILAIAEVQFQNFSKHFPSWKFWHLYLHVIFFSSPISYIMMSNTSMNQNLNLTSKHRFIHLKLSLVIHISFRLRN